MSWYDYLQYENRLYDARSAHSRANRGGDKHPVLFNLGATVGLSAPSSGVSDLFETGFTKYFMNPLIAIPESLFSTPTLSPDAISSKYGPSAGSIVRGPEMATPLPAPVKKAIKKEVKRDWRRFSDHRYSMSRRRGGRPPVNVGLGARYYKTNAGNNLMTSFPRQPRFQTPGYINQFSQNLREQKVRFRKQNPGGIVTAYNAQSVMPKGNSISFGNGTRPGSLRVRTKIDLGTLIIASTGVPGATIWRPSASLLVDIAGMWYCVVDNFNYMGDGIIPRLSQYFDKFAVHNIAMEFNTLIGTNLNYSICWCMCDSPDHWERLGYSTGQDRPLKGDILLMANSQTFPAWKASEFIGCPADSKKVMYTTPPFPPVALWDSTQPIADIRQTIPFTMGVRILGPVPTADLDIGQMFLHIDLELIDMTGLSISYPTSSLSERKTDSPVIPKLVVKKKSTSSKSDSSLIPIRRGVAPKRPPSFGVPVRHSLPHRLIVEPDSPVQVVLPNED